MNGYYFFLEFTLWYSRQYFTASDTFMMHLLIVWDWNGGADGWTELMILFSNRQWKEFGGYVSEGRLS